MAFADGLHIYDKRPLWKIAQVCQDGLTMIAIDKVLAQLREVKNLIAVTVEIDLLIFYGDFLVGELLVSTRLASFRLEASDLVVLAMEEVARLAPPEPAKHTHLTHVLSPSVVQAMPRVKYAKGASVKGLLGLIYDAIGGVLLILHLSKALAECGRVIDTVAATLVLGVPPLEEGVNNARYRIGL